MTTDEKKALIRQKRQALIDAHERLASSIEQLAKVVDILGKLTQQIRYQAQTLPEAQDAETLATKKIITQLDQEVTIH